MARAYIAAGILLAIVSEASGSTQLQSESCCKHGESCWPSKADVLALMNSLNPQANRSLHWEGHPRPYTGSIPLLSKQPLYGLDPIKPVYERTAFDLGCIASEGILETQFCKATTRNLPSPSDGEPAFVLWPLTAQHVQVAVRFAREHNLCVCVAGQGHDYLSRHSCKDGVLIRTGLMKDIEWSLGDKNRFDGTEGSVRLGAGLTFGEVEHSGSQQQPPQFVASGWVTTVGVVGWHTGGGHGPAGRSVGLGVDNILEVELVTPDGNLVTANATHNADLLKGVRGGGGSIWGVITALTVKAHTSAKEGTTLLHLEWRGSMCGTGEAQLHSLIDAVYNFSVNADRRYSGTVWMQPSHESGACSASYHVILFYVFQGATTDATFQKDLAMWLSIKQPVVHNATTAPNLWDFLKNDGPTFQYSHPEEWYIFPLKAPSPGVPSVLLSGDTIQSGEPATLTKAHMNACKEKGSSYCVRHEVFNDIPGTAKFLDETGASVSPGFHDAHIHLMYFFPLANANFSQAWSKLGNASYFAESDAGMADWKQRYWGPNYDGLLQTKQKYDPENLFTCHHCVASDLPRTPSKALAMTTIV